MITPSKITNYHRKRYELEEFLLFCVLCAGKSSEIQARKLEEFLGETTQHKCTPFEIIRWWTDRELLWHMKRAKLGKYKLMGDSFRRLTSAHSLPLLDNWETSVQAKRVWLASYPGIGLKTASLFLLHSVEGCKMAVLDTHLLKYLRKLYPKARVPKASPQCPHKYRQIEDMWLGYCYRNDRDPATYDLEIWNNK
jgi:thermostable 8-oxoguanine DNA glycosylase